MDPRNALSHLTRRTTGMLLHPRQGARAIAGDVKGVLGAGVGAAGHLVGTMVGAPHRGDRGHGPDERFDVLTDPRPPAEPQTESTKVQGDPVSPTPHARRTTAASAAPKKAAAQKVTAKKATPEPQPPKKTAAKNATKAAAAKATPKPQPPKKATTKKTTPKPQPPKKTTRPAPAATSEEEILTPSGIPAAGPGHNPATGQETDLVQPDTEPIVAPSTAKAVRKEAEMMRKAASNEK